MSVGESTKSTQLEKAAQHQLQAGVSTGSSDARRGQSYNPQRSQQFRNGFVRGYAEGFRQYGGYNNNGRYRRNNGGLGNILGGIFGRP